MVDNIKHLGDFLRVLMERENLSIRGLAEKVGVSHSLIIKFLDFGIRDVGYPSVEFLIRLARATNTDIRYLISLVAPDVVQAEINPDTWLLSQEIENLSPEFREAIDGILMKARLRK